MVETASMLPIAHQRLILLAIARWLLLALVVGGLVGSCAAAFLFALEWAGSTRSSLLPWMVLALGPAGVCVAWVYQRFGKRSAGGNNLIIEELHEPTRPLPWLMAPLVVGGTLVSHLFGGSAGREGTAVQMGATIADQLSYPLKLGAADRKVLLAAGVAAGFSALFGTPIAGTLFAVEVFLIGRVAYPYLVPALFSALAADAVCRFWQAPHTHYEIGIVPEFSLYSLGAALAVGIASGMIATLFSVSIQRLNRMFKRLVPHQLLIPLVGGLLVSLLFFIFGGDYLGLGLETIVRSFHEQLFVGAFLLKLIFTVVTLAAGFKGGEVTPLFFIGAALGNALHLVFPEMPLGFLAAMGFVAVFSGAANTPLACIFMAVELFGGESLSFMTVACLTSYLMSAHTGIYSAQVIGSAKTSEFAQHKGQRLADLSYL